MSKLTEGGIYKIAETYGDKALDRRGRYSIEFDDHGLVAFAREIEEETEERCLRVKSEQIEALREMQKQIIDVCKSRKERAERLELQESATGGVPDGWKLVPIEPTQEMKYAAVTDAPLIIKEGYEGTGRFAGTVVSLNSDMFGEAYKAMIAAAPAVPALPPQERLGKEFEDVLHKNLWELYERDEDVPAKEEQQAPGLMEAARLLELWMNSAVMKDHLDGAINRDATRIISFWPEKLREQALDRLRAKESRAKTEGVGMSDWIEQELRICKADSSPKEWGNKLVEKYARALEALQKCEEALRTCDPGDYSTGHVIHASYDADAVREALSAIEGVGK